MFRRVAILFLALIIFPSGLCLLFPQPRRCRVEHLTVRDGLSAGAVNAVVRDRRGFLWLGTVNGLNRYDGYEFREYRWRPHDKGSFRGKRVDVLFSDRKGRLWIGSDHGLSLYDESGDNFTDFPVAAQGRWDPAGDAAIRLEEDGGGGIWIRTVSGGLRRLNPETGAWNVFSGNAPYKLRSGEPAVFSDPLRGGRGRIWFVDGVDGLFMYDPTADTTRHFEEFASPVSGNVATASISALGEDSRGGVWIGDAAGGLRVLDPAVGSVAVIFPGAAGENRLSGGTGCGRIQCLFRDSDGDIWIGSQKSGLFVFRFSTRTIKPVSINPGGAEVSVVFIAQDAAGGLWGVVEKSGVFHLDPLNPESLIFYSHDPCHPYSLSAGPVQRIYPDSSGIIWIPNLADGVDKIDLLSSRFASVGSNPTDNSGFRGNTVSTVYEDPLGGLWVGMAEGFLNYRAPGASVFRQFRGGAGESGDLAGKSRVLCIHGDNSGKVWFGTAFGLEQYTPGSRRIVHFSPISGNTISQTHPEVRALAGATPGRIWVGTAQGLQLLDTHSQRYIHYPSALSHYAISTLLAGRDSALWAGAPSALFKLDPGSGKVTRFIHDPHKKNSLSSPVITSLCEDRRGNIWAATPRGLNRLDIGTGLFRRYFQEDGLPSDNVLAVLEDEQGNLWLSTNRGLTCFDPDRGRMKTFTYRDGLPHHEFSPGACWKNKSGEMFFGGAVGLAVFHPHQTRGVSFIPNLVITRVSWPGAQGVEHLTAFWPDEGKKIVLPASQPIITIDFAALSLSGNGSIRYRHQLEGMDPLWVEDGFRRNITLAGLQPGDYSLRIQGIDDAGEWRTKEMAVKFSVAPSSWSAGFIRLIAVFVLMAVLYYWHRSRMRMLSLQFKAQSKMDRFFTAHNISIREQEVLRLVLQGKSNKNIEDILFISLPTVKSHLYRMYKKLGVKNRLELINLIQGTVQHGEDVHPLRDGHDE